MKNPLKENIERLLKELPPQSAELVRQLSDALESSERHNLAMRQAITLATAPGLWIQREEDIYQYSGNAWYAEVLKKAMNAFHSE